MSKATRLEQHVSGEKLTRLRAEAEFQDRRAAAAAEEPRDKYYFLANRAKEHYQYTLGDVAGRNVLVVGCAEGGVTPLARRGAKVVGIDISAEAIKKLNRSIIAEGLKDTARALVMDAENTDFAPGTFDLVCCAGVLHHLDVERAVSSWSKILKPAGRIVMLEPMAWNPSVALYRHFTPESRTIDEHPLKPVDVHLLRRFFSNVLITPFVLTSVAAAPFAFCRRFPALQRAVLRVFEPIDDFIFRVFPWLRYFAWTVVIDCRNPR
jgi:SAM-dependent methyltransferase